MGMNNIFYLKAFLVCDVYIWSFMMYSSAFPLWIIKIGVKP